MSERTVASLKHESVRSVPLSSEGDQVVSLAIVSRYRSGRHHGLHVMKHYP